MNRYSPPNSFARFAGALAILLGAILTSPAQVSQALHETIATSLRDNYTGTIGCVFKTGSSNVVVSHVGIYNDSGTGLVVNHNAGIFTADGSALLASIAAAAGTVYYYTNGYQWIALDPPMLLSSNTTYLIASDVFNGDGDGWNDATAYSSWNPYFVGSTAGSTRNPRYSSGGAAWPTPPTFGWTGANTSYGNVSLGFLEVDRARVGVATTNIAVAVGQAVNIVGFASGAPTIQYQWYKGGSPLSGKTNSTLAIASGATSDSGSYYLTATNSLGGEQSATVTVLVTAYPVGISQQPTNLTVFASYPAAFSLIATGTPPISYQWSRNGSAVTGATATAYSIARVSQTNNGDVYTCLVSNFISGTGYTQTSSNATLTVTPNAAYPQSFLHDAPPALSTNDFTGFVGGTVTVGNSSALVTHLGYYATQFTDSSQTNATLSNDHHVGIFSADGSVLYGSVVVTAGTHDVLNGYMWAPLNPPLVLSNNTTYLLVAETFSGVDPWGNFYAPTLNSAFATHCASSYGYGTWPSVSANGFSGGAMYSAPNMAVLAPATVSAYVTPNAVTQYVGLNVTLTAFAVGAAPVTVQWYKQPGTLLSGQTNSTLNLNNIALSDAGNYYVIATNSVIGGPSAQSADAVVSVIPDVAPSLDQDITSQAVYPHSTVTFSVTASGTPPLSYQWKFNSNSIAGATNATLIIPNAGAASVGNYQVTITNPYGVTNSSMANLSLISVPWGSYPSAVISPDLLAYYRFLDVNSGAGIATNEGSLGFAYNGTYEGGYSSMAGPTNMSHFEPDNLAVNLDGLTSDVSVPAFNATLTNATIAAWVYSAGGQPDNSAIYFERGSGVSGLSVFGDGTLKYTWGGSYYSFQTGLMLPTNQWGLVAMSVSPTQAVIYLNYGTGLQSVTNVAAHTPATFDANSYVGWDTAGGDIGRRWTGGIDEVMIFDRALSATEVNALYLGVPGSATISVARSGASVTLTWPGGTLLEATNLLGPWTTNGAASPYTTSPTGPNKFYRVRLQ